MTFRESLEPENMLQLYSRGAFVWMDKDENLFWYYPEIRTIIPLDDYNVPRSLKKFMRETDFEFRYDTDVMRVVEECSNREFTWIKPELIAAYEKLFINGNLHSVEVYQKNKLVGGLYGITFRGAFFGESMFSAVSQASKCALVKLLERLNEKNFIVLDVQIDNPHLGMFGTKEIDLEFYNRLLSRAYRQTVEF